MLDIPTVPIVPPGGQLRILFAEDPAMKMPATCLLLLFAAPLAAADKPYNATFSPKVRQAAAARGPAPNCVTPAAPQCDSGGQCRGPCPYCKPPCPGEEERAPGQPESAPGMREAGAFVAPPRVGAMRSAVLRRGIEGGAITLPEIRLKLPSIELPCMFHSRSQARMEIESAVAPWESHGYVPTTSAAELARQKEGAPESAPERCSASERAAKESAAAEDYARQLKEYERLLKQCEQQQNELRECIRRCLENHPGAGTNGSAPLSNERAPVQKPHADPQGEYYPPAPQVDPNARLLPPVYAERPAAFASEQPPASARPLIIREPQRPSGRITGVRPVGQ
ncbi:MAG TPA: hypothetical protein VMP01_24820 [Pirellulaceae bacterium]|nr:hypothetical protein [Pirellulaceae bacterium]